MEFSAGGDASVQQIQYVPASEEEQQQFIIQQEDGTAALDQHALIQAGAKIVDGQIMLPQVYGGDSGETVILVYEGPDGQQQFMTEDGQQIVFENDGGVAIDPAQIISQMQRQEYVSEDQTLRLLVSQSEAVTKSAAAAEMIAPGQSLLAAGVTMSGSMEKIRPGQSLLAPSTAALVQQQYHALDSDVAASHAGTEGMSILSQAVSALEQGNVSGVPSSAADSDNTTTLMSDGKEIQVQVLSSGKLDGQQTGNNRPEQPLETLKLCSDMKTEENTGLATMMGEDGSMQMDSVAKTESDQAMYTMAEEEGGQALVMMENGQIISQPHQIQLIKGENGEQILWTSPGTSQEELDAFIERIKAEGATIGTGNEMQSLVIAEQEAEAVPSFGPGVINPETGLMEEPDEAQLSAKESDQAVFQLNERGVVSQVFSDKTQNSGAVKYVTPPLQQQQMIQQPGEDGSDDSEFDEENLTPKVVYERLLAQHRRTKECQVCGELMENFLRLKEHLMEHAGYNPCECQKCGRILSTPEGRYRHEKAHETKLSPNKSFDMSRERIARKEHLKRHMLIHQDCPTYKCLLCGYSFKREDLIKGHVKKFHPKQVEASSLELLFEKSSDDMAPQRSQWNPHRVYRTQPRPPKIPGRGRGRPRKYEQDSMSAGASVGNSNRSNRTPSHFVIRTSDGSIVMPKLETEDSFFSSQSSLASSRGSMVTSTPIIGDNKRSIKTPKRFVDSAEYNEDEFNELYTGEEEEGEYAIREMDDLDDEDTTDAPKNDATDKPAAKTMKIAVGSLPKKANLASSDTDDVEDEAGMPSGDGDQPLMFQYNPEEDDEIDLKGESSSDEKHPSGAIAKKTKEEQVTEIEISTKSGETRSIQILKKPEASTPRGKATPARTPSAAAKAAKRPKPEIKKKTKKGKAEGPAAINDETLWARQKKALVCFWGIGDELGVVIPISQRPPKPAVAPEDLEEEIVMVVGKGGKSGTKITTSRPPHTPSLGNTAKEILARKSAARNTPSSSATLDTSRSGRAIKRKFVVQSDGSVSDADNETPVSKRRVEAESKLKEVRVQLEDCTSSPPSSPPETKQRGRPKTAETAKRAASDAKSDSESQDTSPARSSGVNKSRRTDAVDAGANSSENGQRTATPPPGVDAKIMSGVKSVKISTPVRDFTLMTAIDEAGGGKATGNQANAAEAATSSAKASESSSEPRSERKRGRPPKNPPAEAKTPSATVRTYSKRTPVQTATDSGAESGGEGGKEETASGEKVGKSMEVVYGTVTIEKGRIVGEITIGQNDDGGADDS